MNRAFRADNGELGFELSDVPAILAACRGDGVEVLGWELWLIDHRWSSANEPVPAAGLWCGGIPLRGEAHLAVYGGSGSVDDAEDQLSRLDLTKVSSRWLPFVRVNFAFEG